MNRLLPVFASLLLSAAAVAADRSALFNGTNFAGWYSWLVDTRYADPRHVFTITNGMIRVSGDGLGYLATSNQFENYRLTVEFKWGRHNSHWGDRIGKARDSGIFVQATGPDGNSDDGNGAFMAAIECNLFQGATGDFLLIRGKETNGTPIFPLVTFEAGARDADGWLWWKPGGVRSRVERWGRINWQNKSAQWKDELDFRGPADVERPYGQWNELNITCAGAKITVVLNGHRVNEAVDVWPRAGKILLQCEGSEIFFRHIALVPLSHDAARSP